MKLKKAPADFPAACERGEQGYPRRRGDAVAEGSVYYETGKLCKHGHIAPRFCSTGTCCECNKAYARETYEKFINDDNAGFWRD
jgi:hypothetical protein